MLNKLLKLCLILTCAMSIILVAPSQAEADAAAAIGDCLTDEEAQLAELINTYRQDNGLSAVPVSKSLVTVAQYHVYDLETYHPDTGTDGRGYACNAHSWSSNGSWTPVCYTSDHEYATGMWNKPKEITNNVYTGYGYENAYWSSAGATAEGAIAGWKDSSAHNAVILNQGIWASHPFLAMGVGIYGDYAVLWFGEVSDPQGTLIACNALTTDAFDVNNDNIVSPADVVYTLNRINTTDLSADVNNDEVVNVTDANLVVDHLGETVE